jgi:hypothetical protein
MRKKYHLTNQEIAQNKKNTTKSTRHLSMKRSCSAGIAKCFCFAEKIAQELKKNLEVSAL